MELVRLGGVGGGAYSFVGCLSRLTMTMHAFRDEGDLLMILHTTVIRP